MLTEAEKMWLETRLQNLKVSGWFSCTEGELIPLVNFHRKHLHSDFQDAAEFEARVAAIMPYIVFRVVAEQAGQKDIIIDSWTCLKLARLAVEAEMEAESAGC